MITAGLALAGSVFGYARDWVVGKQEITKAKDSQTAKQISADNSNNHHWEMAQINKSDMWLRRICFVQLSLPFWWAAFDAQAVVEYFAALDGVPEWYVSLYVTVVLVIWGVAETRMAMRARMPKQNG